ncbi:glycoside hydrolase family 3 protein [Mucilaginibacter paludis]|uniref:beta-N-acetylhexosaminidase n=1 Tax=Mucilaginibacter paludis DSM 18603 TaxID=714943 RepID=H1XZL8_9SPHI|nr:glycoside hydrolase family 3 N-terminal domain-containing protein [Mucilaginibacter paludis]EHQ26662.1 glycoside hydrolase family 3 domain protein [Mucilaginibacter paludis DSM 18603]
MAFSGTFKSIPILLLISITTQVSAQNKESFIKSLNQQNHWVDSVFNKLSKKQKIAQLFMVRAHTNRGQAFEDSIGHVIKKEKIGGLVFFQGGPQRQAVLTNRYQKLAKVPLLIAMDGEWGLAMRLDSTMSYPYQMTLGAIQDNTLIYKMGQEVANDFKRLGMQMNFAPDMDVNNNPNNPVIGYRSFGDNKFNVAKKGIAYMQGMQNNGILTTAKHFPGHGDTDVDSHFDLPQLTFNRERLDSLEEYPFREAIAAGISGIMVAHMNIPALDSTKNLPSTLSKPIITGILKDSLGFKGLTVSDAMEMKGVVKFFPKGEADVRAFIAGNDILELSENTVRAVKMIKKAIHKHEIPKEEFERRVKKVLTAKYWAGLSQPTEVSTSHLAEDLNRPEAKALVQQLCDSAITMLKNDTAAPLVKINPKVALISIGIAKTTVFQQGLNQWYPNSTMFNLAKNASVTELKQIIETLKGFDKVIIGVHDSRLRPGSKLDYTSDVKMFIAEMASHNNTAISVFANPYSIAGLPGIEQCGTLLMGYQMSDEMQRSAVKVLTGQAKATGKLPVSVNTFFPYGTGLAAR